MTIQAHAVSNPTYWQPGKISIAFVIVIAMIVLLVMARRRGRAREAALPAHTIIGWKDWRYRGTWPGANTPFFGTERARPREPWVIGRVEVCDWIHVAGTQSSKPATDGRHGQMSPPPPKVEFSLQKGAFLHASKISRLFEQDGEFKEQRTVADCAAESGVAETDITATANAVAGGHTPFSTNVGANAASEAEDIEPSVSETVRDIANTDHASRCASLEPESRRRSAHHTAPRDNEQPLAEDKKPLTTDYRTRRLEALASTPGNAIVSGAGNSVAPGTACTPYASRTEFPRPENEQKPADGKAPRDADQAVSEAKKQLTAGYPKKALEAMAPIMLAKYVSGEAWTVIGWCWWRIARDNGQNPVEAVSQAVAAFQRAAKAEPDRESMLGDALVRCYLFMADHLEGQARAESLDAALRLMGGDMGEQRAADDQLVTEHAHALYQRALLAPLPERALLLEKALRLLSGSREHALDDDRLCLLASLWMARAESAKGRAVDELLARATEALTYALNNAAPNMVDTWLARVIDVELVRLRRCNAAARLMRLRQLRDTYQLMLAKAHSMQPLLSWIQVLREWAAMLSERPARAKLEEMEPLFVRIESLAPDDIGSIHFARAYYLRMRSSHEPIGAALQTLDDASTLLTDARSSLLTVETIALERAEIAIARAKLVDGRERLVALEQAIRLADMSIDAKDNNLAHALTCGITARLIRFDTVSASQEERDLLVSLANRLIAMSPSDAEALHLAATSFFTAGRHAEAVTLCDAAWDAGCRDARLLSIWQETLRGEAGLPVQNQPQWKRLNQCIRTLQSTGQTTCAIATYNH
ncbi:hypothetical protein [Dyella japonica]|nr:hypothetical protein [Dyella japonica]